MSEMQNVLFLRAASEDGDASGSEINEEDEEANPDKRFCLYACCTCCCCILLLFLVLALLVVVWWVKGGSDWTGSGVPVDRPLAKPMIGNMSMFETRVQALSPTLVRIEPMGPKGFEDRTTFMVVDRGFSELPITRQQTPEGMLWTTSHYSVLVRGRQSTLPPWAQTTCSAPVVNTADFAGAGPPGGLWDAVVGTREDCCKECDNSPVCVAWVYNTVLQTCRVLMTFAGTVSKQGHEFGCSSRGCGVRASPSFLIKAPSGASLYDSDAETNPQPNLLHWPSPLTATAYSLMDYPRFYVPPWGPTPIPEGATVETDLEDTNGYDFRNNVQGDTYVFLLGNTLKSWQASRAEMLQLTGPTPLLPDYAYGTWFTYWHLYTEAEAKDDIERWGLEKLPLDIWGLDMNWRLKGPPTYPKDYVLFWNLIRKAMASFLYSYPETGKEFPDWDEWFQWLKNKGLRTYFNDHPLPRARWYHDGQLQLSQEEVTFRYHGLTEWMARGLTYWWFDRNWGFSIPPPFIDTLSSEYLWEGLDTASWGSHVYYETVKIYNANVRDAQGDTFYGGRPITLTKFDRLDWRPEFPAVSSAESPAQHRYPVWWTGDNVDLQASVHSMVNSGVHDLKPFVHSDCGGDVVAGQEFSPGSLMRWTAHCAFGTILRIHGGDHRPWRYDNHTTNVIRSYLRMRYRLIPSLISAGHRATLTGFPYVTRGDLYWPEHKESASSDQYIFLDDVLVAPLGVDQTTRSVWVPPGDWEDAWTGEIVKGPASVTVQQPDERGPMWFRHDGGLLVACDDLANRVDAQSWTSLTLEAFPSSSAMLTRRLVYERATPHTTEVEMRSDGTGQVLFAISTTVAIPRAWVLRLHLRPGESGTDAHIDGSETSPTVMKVYKDHGTDLGYTPLGVAGSAAAPQAGPVLELRLPMAAGNRSARIRIHPAATIAV